MVGAINLMLKTLLRNQIYMPSGTTCFVCNQYFLWIVSHQKQKNQANFAEKTNFFFTACKLFITIK